jgi:hypothetical protein
MVVVDTPSGSFLVTFYLKGSGSGNREDRWVRFDGTSWTDDGHGGINNLTEHELFVHKGIVYASNPQGGSNIRVSSFEPITRTVQQVTILTNDAPNLAPYSFSYFSLDDRLFLWAVGSSAAVTRMWEFKLGAWVRITPAGIPTWDTANGNAGSIRIGQDVFIFSGDDVSDALVCMKVTVPSPGATPVCTVITAPIPAALQAGSTIGTPNNYRCFGFVDTVSTPGTPIGYLTFYPDGTITAIPTIFRWVDESTEMTVAASPQILGSSGIPIQLYGGGENLNGLSTATSRLVTTSPDGNSQGTDGVQVDFEADGDPVRVSHDASGPAFTLGLVVTQTPSGATGTIDKLSTTNQELWLRDVTGTFVAGQTITDSGTGSAVQVGASAGGANDKTVQARYHLVGQEAIGVPSTGLCSIVPGSVTGGGGATDSGGNSIINVTADGRQYTWEWDFLADGVPEGVVANIEIFVTRP